MNKIKAVGGLDFLKNFMIALSVVVVLAFVLVIIMSTGMNSILPTTTGSGVNETILALTEAPRALSASMNPLCHITSAVMTVRTSGAIITGGNYSYTDCNIYMTTAGAYNNSNVNVSYEYSYTTNGDAYNVIANYTSGISTLSQSITTWITLAGLVVIIGIIAIVIYLVSRFGGTAEMG